MGVGVVTVDETTSETYGWPTGAYVREVTAGGAAEKAGIKVGDIIVAIDGTAVTTADEVSTIKNKHSVGDVLTVTISRNNEKQDLKLTLEEATS
jgi:serine protease Do